MTPVLTAGPGLDFADLAAVGLAFLGLAVLAAIAALSNQRERAFSASIVYLALGLGAAALLGVLEIDWLDAVEDAAVVERLTEFAVIVSLFGAGLKLDRELRWRAWGSVARLLGLVMPLTIAAVAAYGATTMGLSLAAAIVLGAALAPTDPVLAGDVGVGPPDEEDEREPNFSITAEAGLNDGLAFPFVVLGLVLATGERDWGWEWALADVLYAIPAGLAIGAVVGWGLAALAVRLRARRFLATSFDGWIAVAAVLVIYGLAEIASTYGFLAAFAGGLAFRRHERGHELNARVHEGAEVTEKFAELGAILLVGTLATRGGLAEPGLAGWLLVPLLLLVVRPLAVLVAFAGSPLPLRERVFLGWFGVRGIGSLYYVAAAASVGSLAAPELSVVLWTTFACVAVSILVHGATGTPVTARTVGPRLRRSRRPGAGRRQGETTEPPWTSRTRSGSPRRP
ncbi:MAG: cation:proton antiporter [Thermoleophilia bacterium]